MKVVKSAQHYTETALDEIKLLKCVSITIAIQCSITIITVIVNLKKHRELILDLWFFYILSSKHLTYYELTCFLKLQNAAVCVEN